MGTVLVLQHLHTAPQYRTPYCDDKLHQGHNQHQTVQSYFCVVQLLREKIFTFIIYYILSYYILPSCTQHLGEFVARGSGACTCGAALQYHWRALSLKYHYLSKCTLQMWNHWVTLNSNHHLVFFCFFVALICHVMIKFARMILLIKKNIYIYIYCPWVKSTLLPFGNSIQHVDGRFSTMFPRNFGLNSPNQSNLFHNSSHYSCICSNDSSYC